VFIFPQELEEKSAEKAPLIFVKLLQSFVRCDKIIKNLVRE
jgi:hypothetical protein